MIRLKSTRRLIKSVSKCRAFSAASDGKNSTQTLRTEEKPLPEKADYVVVGGGVVGTSLAYHLAKQSQGTKKVLLLEKTELTAGSTWHAVGLTTNFHPGINIKRLHWYSMNFYSQLEKETGQQLGFHQCGSIRVATSPVRVDEMKYQMARQGWNQAPQTLLDIDQIVELCPIINTEKILAGLYTPGDGYIDPYSLTQGIAAGARLHGATIMQKTEVTSLEQLSDGGWRVGTPKGAVDAETVINCSGFWAKDVAKMCDMNLPLVPMEHQYVVSKSVPEIQALKREIPVLRDLNGSYYLRQERDGILVGPYEMDAQARADWATNGVPHGFGKELYPPDIDRLAPHLEAAMDLVPCFATAEIQSMVNGPITYTPDVLPAIGPTLMPNMWLAVGFAYGIVHAGGVGQYLANWILKGEPEYSLTELDPLRYGKWATNEYAIAKCTESYQMNNAVGYPHEERLVGRPTYRISGVHDELIKAGAFMGFHAGWEQPDWYTVDGSKPEYKPSFYRTNHHDSILNEHELVTNKVGLIDLTPFAKIKVSGSYARAFLDYAVAGTVPKAGRTSLAHALTDGGKVMAEWTITGDPSDKETFIIVTGSGVELHDIRHLEKVKQEEEAWSGVKIENITEDLGVLSVAGPLSPQLMNKCLEDGSVDGWKFLDARRLTIGGVSDCLAVRISYTGEHGWEIYMPRDQMGPVYRALMEAGRDYGIGHFGTFAVNVMRIEKGFKMWGNEMNLDCTALQAGLDPFIRFTKKADFKGKSALLAEKKGFTMNRLVMLEIEMPDGAMSKAWPEGNLSVWSAGRVVGNVTSGTYSPATNKGLGFAYVPSVFSYTGSTDLEVEVMGERWKTRVLSGPPVSTASNRHRSKKGSAQSSAK